MGPPSRHRVDIAAVITKDSAHLTTVPRHYSSTVITKDSAHLHVAVAPGAVVELSGALAGAAAGVEAVFHDLALARHHLMPITTAQHSDGSARPCPCPGTTWSWIHAPSAFMPGVTEPPLSQGFHRIAHKFDGQWGGILGNR